MTIHQYLMKARQDDARRAGERDRLLLEARRASQARRQRPDPAAPARRMAQLLFRRMTQVPRGLPPSSEHIEESRVHTPVPPGSTPSTTASHPGPRSPACRYPAARPGLRHEHPAQRHPSR